MDDNIEKIEFEDDPNRCQAVHSKGQCRNKANPGSTFCLCHGGNKAPEKANKRATNYIRLTKFRARLDEKAESDSLKSLKDEIAILRIVMEETLNKCKNEVDIVLCSASIGDLAVKIEKLVTSCNKLDKQLGEYLDKGQLTQIMMEIVDIIGDYITDSATLIKMTNRITQIITRDEDDA